MKQGRTIQTVAQSTTFRIFRLQKLVFASLAFSFCGPILAESPSPAKVDVFAQHSGGKIMYHYRAFNNSQRDIASITIGLDSKNDENPVNDIYELIELPSGWNLKFGIPSTSSNSPTGWRVSVTKPEESKTHAITWEPLNENTPKLLGGQVLAKMSVAVDKADLSYLSGDAHLTYHEGNPAYITVPLERLDNAPPSLEVNLSPSVLRSSNGKPVPVKATFTVKDDYDRRPEIKLESITANEALGPDDISDASIGADDRYLLFRAEHKIFSDRIYTVTYSATDASGNQTLASATVTITESTITPAPVPVSAPLAASAPIATPVAAPAPVVKPATPASVTKPSAVPHAQTEIKKPAGKNP